MFRHYYRIVALASGLGLAAGDHGSALVSCVPAESQHDEATYGTWTVALGPSLDGVWDWTPHQREVLTPALADLSRLGPTVRVVSEGDDPDVVLRAANLPAGMVARYTLHTRYVEVDAAQAQGDPELASRGLHEVIHTWLIRRYNYLGHVCRRVGESNDCHPRVYGEAVMNPGTSLRDWTGPTFTEAWTGDFPNVAVTSADLALVRDLEANR